MRRGVAARGPGAERGRRPEVPREGLGAERGREREGEREREGGDPRCRGTRRGEGLLGLGLDGVEEGRREWTIGR